MELPTLPLLLLVLVAAAGVAVSQEQHRTPVLTVGDLNLRTLPRNLSAISPYYQGSWVITARKTTAAVAPANSSSGLPPAAPRLLRRGMGDLFVAVYQSKKGGGSSGAAAFVDMADAQVIMRDGVYSTDRVVKYVAKGAYVWPLGVFLAFALPESVAGRPPYLTMTPTTAPPNLTAWFDRVLGTGEGGGAALPTVEKLWKTFFEFEVPRGLEVARLAFRVSVETATTMTAGAAKTKGKVDESPTGKKLSRPVISMVGDIVVHGRDEELHMYATLKTHSIVQSQRSALYYVVFVFGASLLELLLLIRQMDASEAPAAAARVSTGMIGLQALFDSYLSLVHLVFSVLFTQTLFYAFGAASFIYFVKFSMFEMRYMMTVWKAQNPALFNQNGDAVRNRLSLMYMKFYTVLLAGFLCVYYNPKAIYVLVAAMFSLWVPQIFTNLWNGTSGALTPHFIIGTSITRTAIPLYFMLLPSNFVRFQPSYGLSVILLSYLGFQVLVLRLQDIKGPRFFVPKMFLPARYDYGRPIPANVLAGSVDGRLDCVICMSHVDAANVVRAAASVEDPAAASAAARAPAEASGDVSTRRGHREGEQVSVEDGLQRRPAAASSVADHVNQTPPAGYMITPCDHVYHAECLLRWMDFKLECPTCRAVLPVP